MYLDYSTVENTVTDVKAINNSLRNILLTKKGSVPGKPRFGSDISSLIFSQIDHITVHLLKNLVKEAIDEFEPRVNIQKIDINEIPEYNRIIVNIKYTYVDSGIDLNGTLSVPVQ